MVKQPFFTVTKLYVSRSVVWPSEVVGLTVVVGVNGEQGQSFLLEIFLFTAHLFVPLAGCFVAVAGSKNTALIGIWHLNDPVSTIVTPCIQFCLYHLFLQLCQMEFEH